MPATSKIIVPWMKVCLLKVLPSLPENSFIDRFFLGLFYEYVLPVQVHDLSFWRLLKLEKVSRSRNREIGVECIKTGVEGGRKSWLKRD